MLNDLALHFAQWIAAKPFSSGLHESFYMFNWLESTHVLTLMVSLGTLVIIDLRMLGVWLTDVPASKVAARLTVPMFVGFTIMVITGTILYTAIPIRYTQNIWFRTKVILMIIAGINAYLFHRHLNASVGTWDTDKKPPSRTRLAAALSLSLWTIIVICGRFIAYDWYDCGRPENSATMNVLEGCNSK